VRFRRIWFSQANCRDQDLLAAASAATDDRLIAEDGYMPAVLANILSCGCTNSIHKARPPSIEYLGYFILY